MRTRRNGPGNEGPVTLLQAALAVLALGVVTLVGSCGGGGDGTTAATSNSTTNVTPSAAPNSDPLTAPPDEVATTVMVSTNVAVPAGMRAAPFDTARTLNVPAGMAVSVAARVPGARFMALAPNGDLLVSNPGNGTLTLLRFNADRTLASRATFASGLTNPHDMVFHAVGGTTYLYVAESNRIIRAPYRAGDTAIGAVQAIVTGLPDASSPELNGAYGHQLKNIAIDGGKGKLYVSVASTCNACASDTVADPVRGAVYEYNLDGSGRRLFARGLRNAEGLAFRPGSSELWVTVNNRDEIAFPRHADWDGDGQDDYGRVMQSYVDKHPPDLLVKVRDGGQYGWPFCNANPDQTLNNMPYDRDVQLNADGSQLDCSAIDRATKGLPPHSAPLGASFLNGAGLPAPFDSGMAIALHGCWNCSALNGHKIAWYPVRADGSVGDGTDLVTGWVTDSQARVRWGRPVDAVPDGKGGLFISDDFAGAIYRLAPGG